MSAGLKLCFLLALLLISPGCGSAREPPRSARDLELHLQQMHGSSDARVLFSDESIDFVCVTTDYVSSLDHIRWLKHLDQLRADYPEQPVLRVGAGEVGFLLVRADGYSLVTVRRRLVAIDNHDDVCVEARDARFDRSGATVTLVGTAISEAE